MYQGKTLSIKALENNFLELNFDHCEKSVNVFNRETVAELTAALDILEGCDTTQGLLVTSGKSVFVVGADITEFSAGFAAGKDDVRRFMWQNIENLNRLEQLPFPVVVAVNGFALGGGFEFCLACDYRVMSSSARIGFPEVGLGIIPGWGGTVRAPRLAGLERALEWVALGQQHKAEDALNSAMVDAVAEPAHLRQTALDWLRQAVVGELDIEERRRQKTGAIAIGKEASAKVGEEFKSKVGNVSLAATAAVDEIVGAVALGRDQALDVEFDTFYTLTQTDQARALIGNFTNEQYVNAVAKKYAASASKKTSKVGVLGAGTMGGGIAFQNAVRNIPVVMKDIDHRALDIGMDQAQSLLLRQVARGSMSEDQARNIQKHILPTLDYGAIGECNLIIEAVVEKEAVKKVVLAEVESLVADDVLLASNTSSMEISTLAKALQRPENFCGLHFFNPVHAMPLVEVVRGDKTSDESVSRAVAYVLALGKKPIVVNDGPAFFVNRVLFPYLAGFNMLMREGADLADIDRVMECWGWPMGPAYLCDVIGIDVAVHAGDVVAESFPDRLQLDYQSAIHLICEAGRFGQKNGAGFYRYEKNEAGRLTKRADPQVEELLKGHVGEPRSFSDEEIIQRMMIPMCTEMARCLDETIVASPQEADLALLYGLGFPSFRGGICRWMDELGLAEVCAMAENYKRLGGLYQPTKSMLEMASRGLKYYSES